MTNDNSGAHQADTGSAVRADDGRGAPITRSETPTRSDVVERQREEHGGMKIGSAFFGWLTATGMSLVLTALAAAAGAAVGLATNTTVKDATSAAQSRSQVDTIGLVSGIVLLVILFLAYYCGGYVAGRMARFDGLKQGLAVWLWAIVVAIVVAIVGAVAGSQYDVLSTLNGFPRLPIGSGTLSTAGIIALVVLVLATLGGALLGGLAGMRFHRKVDKTGLGR